MGSTKSKPSAPVIQDQPPPRTAWWFAGVVLVFALLVYRSVLMPGQILITSDDNIGHIAMRKALLPEGFLRAWLDLGLAGQPFVLSISWTNLLAWIMPARLFQNAIHALDLGLASVCLALFFRERGVRWAAAAVGALTAFWLGSSFFLTYAGHIGKFGVVLFAAVTLWCVECAVRRRSVAWAVLAGGAMGSMFLEQADVALFFSMVLGPYALFATWRERGFNLLEQVRVVLPMVVIALLIAVRAIWVTRAFFTLDASIEAPPEDRQQVWSYCTQWSWPPEETLEWIAPGYYGWRSGEPTGPYWGRLGRSEGWEQTRQGYPNFKLETLYLGAFPVVLAALSLFLAFRLRRLDRADVVFWAVAALVTFLLGLGKFSPLYRLFFEIPGMSSIRAPVKFMQVTQFALGILASLGLEGVLRCVLAPERERLDASRFAWFLRALWALGGLVLLMAMGQAVSSTALVQKIAAEGWGQAASVMVDNRIRALVHAGLMVLGAGGLLVALLKVRQNAAVHRLAWVAASVVALDQLSVSHRYVHTAGVEGYVAANPVTDYLQRELGDQRAFMVNQGSFYNHWLSVLFPYFSLPTYNVAQIRMSKDYEQFLAVMGQDLLRIWQFFAVGQVMGPAGLWPELQNHERFRGKFDLGLAYNVAPRGAGVDVMTATPNRPGQHVIVRHLGAADRFALAGQWEGRDGPDALQRLRDPSFQPLDQVVVPVAVADTLPKPQAPGRAGTVEVEKLASGYARLKVSSDRAAVLRASDSFSPFWRARLNGKPVDVFRCDYVFVGVSIPAGLHSLELEHQPPLLTLGLQLSGMAACMFALLMTVGRPAPVKGP
jgi:hypothetical protein